MVRRSRSGHVKHLEGRWLWLQERTRAEELHVGTVEIALNSDDLGTKFHPRRRFDELMILPVRIGVGLMTSLGEEGHRTERDNGDALWTSFTQQAVGLLWYGRQCKMTAFC